MCLIPDAPSADVEASGYGLLVPASLEYVAHLTPPGQVVPEPRETGESHPGRQGRGTFSSFLCRLFIPEASCPERPFPAPPPSGRCFLLSYGGEGRLQALYKTTAGPQPGQQLPLRVAFCPSHHLPAGHLSKQTPWCRRGTHGMLEACVRHWLLDPW